MARMVASWFIRLGYRDDSRDSQPLDIHMKAEFYRQPYIVRYEHTESKVNERGKHLSFRTCTTTTQNNKAWQMWRFRSVVWV